MTDTAADFSEKSVCITRKLRMDFDLLSGIREGNIPLFTGTDVMLIAEGVHIQTKRNIGGRRVENNRTV